MGRKGKMGKIGGKNWTPIKIAHSRIGAKNAGKWRLEGKDYRMQDGDGVPFRFNV